MPGRFAGRLALVTGASAGIGAAVVRAFAAEGARTVAVARSRERLESLAAELGGPAVVLPVGGDVADGAAMAVLAAEVLRTAGVPDVVVANAGIGLDARFLDTSDEDMRAVLETNVLGVLRTVRPFLPGMIARGSGSVVMVSSVVGKRGVPHYAAYAASKFALHGMLDALRPELHGTGVRAGIVCPSSTETEFQQRIRRAGPSQNTKRPRRHSAESVARAVLRMAETGRREHVLTAEGKLMVWADAMAPGLVDRVLARVFRQRRRG